MIHQPFQLMPTFCGVGQDTKPIGIIGAPIDCATTFRSGARMGPNAIRQASLMLTDGTHPKYSVRLSDYAQDLGNMSLPTGNTHIMLAAIECHILDHSDKHLITLGGDHSITLGILRALYKKHKDIAVVHFDAHCDTWFDHFGEPHGHGTWLYNAIERKLIQPKNTISIGIRSPSDEISRNYLEKSGGTTVTASRAMKWSPAAMAEIIKTKVQDKPAYLSFDIDCLDPAFAPGTGTPEIGGLTTSWVRELLDLLDDIHWIGMDCVEVSPPYDHSEITALAAATFCWQYASMIANKIK